MSISSALSIAVDEVPLDEVELLGFLHFRIYTAVKAQGRNHWFGGRIFNALSGQSPIYIPLSGTHLRQTLSFVGLQPPESVVAQGRYELRLDYAQRAYDALKSKLDAESK